MRFYSSSVNMASAENPILAEKRAKLQRCKSRLAKLSKGISALKWERQYLVCTWIKGRNKRVLEGIWKGTWQSRNILTWRTIWKKKRSRNVTNADLDSLLVQVQEYIAEIKDSSASSVSENGGGELTENSISSSKRRRQLAELKVDQTRKRHELQRKMQELNNQQAELQRELEAI